ncbi:MAG: site-2 protease family protein [bacterium]|nr:MAG: site-2 protease family protein [bacterium]
MFGRQVPVARIGGLSIVVDPSWFIIFIFVAWGLSAGYFPQVVPGRPTAVYWVAGVLASLSLFLSVTLHELGHSLVARARGMEVRRIVLFLFGGVSQLEEEPGNPRTEFVMAIVGPLISFALAAAFWLIHGLLPAAEAPSLLGSFLIYLSVVNFALGVFNLLPGFPLDGGRVLRSLLWSRWKDLVRATRVASQVGAGFGLGLMILGGINILSGNPMGGFWYALIGFFLRNAAQTSFRQLTVRSLLEGITVGELMTRDPITVDPSISLETFVDDFILRHHHRAFPVTEGGRLVGLADMDAVKRVPREGWKGMTVREVMTPLTELRTVTADQPAAEAIKTIGPGVGRVLVAAGGRLEGILSRRDLMDLITLKSDLRGPGR